MYHVAMRPSLHSRYSSRRRGRVLVECCVSVVLVAGGSSVLLLASSTTARLVDSARQHDVVLGATSNRLAPLFAVPCAVGAGTRRETLGPRTVIDVEASAHGGLRDMRVAAWWQPSALAEAGLRHHEVTSVARCE